MKGFSMIFYVFLGHPKLQLHFLEWPLASTSCTESVNWAALRASLEMPRADVDWGEPNG